MPGSTITEAARIVDLGIAGDLLGHREAHPAAAALDRLRPGLEIAGELVQQRIGDEIDRVVDTGRRSLRRGDALIDDLDETGEAVLAILLGEAADLGVDGFLGLGFDEIGGREIDEGKQRQHRGREQREIDRRETKGAGVDQPGQRNGYSALRR